MYLANNIDLVQINIKAGVDEYYLPKNVNWRNRVIDKLVIVTDTNGTGELSPIDGQTQLVGIYTDTAAALNCYLDLYANDDTQVARNVWAANMFAFNNNNISVGYALSLNLSRLFFTSPPMRDGCILVYVYYGGKDVEETDPTKESVTVEVELAANGRMSLQDIVDNYIYMQPKKIKGVYIWGTGLVYLTLRYADNIHVLNSLPTILCRPPMFAGNAIVSQVEPLMLDNINIDMLNSYVQNAINEDQVVKITFLY